MDDESPRPSNDELFDLAFEVASGLPCLLCAGPSKVAGIWVPTDAYDEFFEQTPGRRTSFGYALCFNCRNTADVRPRIAATLVAQHGIKTNDGDPQSTIGPRGI